MKAIVYTKYGGPGVLKFKEVEKPVLKDNQVLIKVKAASVNYSDWAFLRGKPFFLRFFSGLFKPKYKILGDDFAGVVEAVGKNVKEFKPGDEVFGDLEPGGREDWGGFSEYVCASEDFIALKSANISFEEAAATPRGAMTALQGICFKGKIQPGQKVLVNGASGGVGIFVVQILKSFGAEVTAVCSTGKLDMVRSLGADYVIDYTKEDFTKNGQCYDYIFAVNGYHSLSDYKRALSSNGIYVCIGGSGAQILGSMVFAPFRSIGNKKMYNMGAALTNKKDLTFIKTLLDAGKIKPVIDKSYPLEEVPEAFRFFGEGHTKGKIVITME